MGKGLVALIFVSILCGPAHADLRVFFDKTPTADRGDLTEHAGLLAFENPVVQPDERLYLYFEFHGTQHHWFSVSFDVTAEDGLITRAHMFNGFGQIVKPLEERWIEASPNPPVTPGVATVEFHGAEINRFGVDNGVLAEFRDVHQFRRPGDDGGSIAGTTLLGFVDVAPLPGIELSEVFLSVGPYGFAGPDKPGGHRVFFGFGDDSVQNKPGARSRLPDAIVVPEPGALALLLLLGGLLAARRR